VKKTKGKILFGMLALAMLSSLLTGAFGSGNGFGQVKPSGATYSFTFTGEGQSKSYYSNLASLADRDKFVMTTTVKLTITVIVADCCIMGDTIGIFYPTSTTLLMSKKSPGIIVGTATFAAGTYTWWVGYVACPGGFPAGYWTWILATHG